MYISRFAPSPSGPLHFGSLVCALASYLETRKHNGRWHLRIEDLDPPRTVPNSDQLIIKQLQAHGLNWDGDIVYQSDRSEQYQIALESLSTLPNIYPCNCTRKRLNAQGGFENGYCLEHTPKDTEETAIRLKMDGTIRWKDSIQGWFEDRLDHSKELILKRRDGLFAYPLAVVVDDIALGVTHVLRGSDLLDVAAGQQFLYHAFGKTAPQYAHIPVATNEFGSKLSKQNRAPGINPAHAGNNLREALRFLGQNSFQATGSIDDIVSQALEHWDIASVPQSMLIKAPDNLAQAN